MPEYSRGLTVQRNAKRLLEALLNAADRKLERSDRSKKPLKVSPLRDPPGLSVTCTINSLVELSQQDKYSGGLTYAKVEAAIVFLEEFLGILQRPENQQGSIQQLTLHLWEQDNKKNLDRFDRECDRKRHHKATQTNKDPWTRVRHFVPPEFDLLDQKFFQKRQGGESKILELPTATWSLVTQGSYIERDQQGDALALAEELAESSGISLLLIRGEPGAGKTALMRWLAYELSSQGRIVLQTKKEDLYWLEPLWEFSEQIGEQHFYLIADDLFRDASILDELDRNELQFPLTLIGTTRLNEDQQDKLRMRGYQIKHLDLELSPSPESQEKQRILERIGQQDPEAKARLDLKTPVELEKLMAAPSMLVLMLQLSEGKPFDLIVADIIKRLPSEEDYPVYQVFGVICSFYQYGITTPPGVLPLCLPKYSSNEVQNVVDLAIHPEHPELKGLVNTIFKGGFEGLTTIHELIAQTAMTVKYSRNRGENLPYSSNSLEDHLRAAIQALDATKEIHKRWVYHGLRLLASNGKAALVRQVVSDYPDQIQFLQQGGKLSDLSYWAKLYEAMGLLTERDRCISAILSTKPQNESQWTDWLLVIETIESFVTNQQKQKVIAQTTAWLQNYPLHLKVRIAYILLAKKPGTLEQWREALAQATIDHLAVWLQHHPENISVREKYLRLGLIERNGTVEQKQEAITQTARWLQHHPEDTRIRRSYLILLANVGEEIADIESMISQQWQWLMQQQRVELSLWNAFLSVLHYSYRAFEYPESILADNPEHCMAYLCMAQCYQAKGQEFYPQAFNSFQKAIEFDPEKNGCLWYEFGCFCRDAMRNRTEARKCFENSLNQKSNLLACVDLAELEVEDGNLNRAREVLQQGLSLVTKEQWEKLEPRIQAIQAQLGW